MLSSSIHSPEIEYMKHFTAGAYSLVLVVALLVMNVDESRADNVGPRLIVTCFPEIAYFKIAAPMFRGGGWLIDMPLDKKMRVLEKRGVYSAWESTSGHCTFTGGETVKWEYDHIPSPGWGAACGAALWGAHLSVWYGDEQIIDRVHFAGAHDCGGSALQEVEFYYYQSGEFEKRLNGYWISGTSHFQGGWSLPLTPDTLERGVVECNWREERCRHIESAWVGNVFRDR